MSLFVSYADNSILKKSGVFWFGRYSGLPVAPILESEPGYIIWAAENIPWLTIDPQLLKEANELYDKTEDAENADFTGYWNMWD